MLELPETSIDVLATPVPVTVDLPLCLFSVKLAATSGEALSLCASFGV